MSWKETFPRERQPLFEQIGAYIGSQSWDELNDYLQATYGVTPKIEHSICSGAPGWNVKYKKNGRSLCVLYPDKGFFTCLVSIGAKEAQEAELLLSACTEYTRQLYWNAQPLNGARWLMLAVTAPAVLEDAKKLISTRMKHKEQGEKTQQGDDGKRIEQCKTWREA